MRATAGLVPAAVAAVAVAVAVAAATGGAAAGSITAAPARLSARVSDGAVPAAALQVAARPLVALAGAVPAAGAEAGAQLLGPASPAAVLKAHLYLRPSDGKALESFVAAVSTPGSASYHHFLTVPQFATRFGASPAEIGALDQYLRTFGLSVGALARDHLAQLVSGRAGDFEAAFGTELQKLRTAKGARTVSWASVPKLPAGVAGTVSFVGGLGPPATHYDNLVRFPKPARFPHGLVQGAGSDGTGTKQAAATCSGMASAGLTPAQLASAYGLTGFYARGDSGQGQTIGLIEYALADTAAISAFQACAGSSLTIYYDPTSSPPSQVDSEVAADVEVVAALAPRATVEVYESDQSGTGLGPWQMAVSGGAGDPLPDVISSSWGACEAGTGMGAGYYKTEETLFEEAAAQGQTVLVASGDDGSEGCFDQSASSTLAVDDPASAPYVTAVGGTASDTTTGPQYVWNSRGATPASCLGTGCASSGASGGGASDIWARPAYQSPGLPQSSECLLGAQGCRELPDVSALAGDPYAQYCSTSVCGGGSPWVGFGGTSLSAPSWGAAVLLSEGLCTSRAGFLNPLLYREPSSLTGRVTSGDNDLTGTNSGLYSASPAGGYSMAAGLGYLGGASLPGGALCGPGNVAPTTTTAPASPTTTTPPGGTPTTTAVPGPTTTAPPATGPPSPPSTVPVPPSATVPPTAFACSKPKDVTVAGAPVAIAASAHNGCAGYWVVTAQGQVAAFGSAVNYGSARAGNLKAPVVAITATPDYLGYWLLTAKGRVLAFGDAQSYGDLRRLRLSAPMVGLAATPDGGGYWIAGKDGGVFALGDANFYGSMGGRHLDRPITGMAPGPRGKGYWLVASDGGVFGFGDAKFYGSMGSAPLNSPVVGVSAGPGAAGYRLVAADGGIFSFGAPFYGSLASKRPRVKVITMAPSVDGKGYYLFGANGDIYAYGDAAYLGKALT
ncbi:MAG: S53 family peptidase [Acidimicrobiales bacterium]